MKNQFLLTLVLFCFSIATGFSADIKILPLGDSITQGAGNGDLIAKGSDSYRRLLYIKLKQAGYKVDFVGSMKKTFRCGNPVNNDFDPDHEGHSAWRTDEIIRGLNNGCTGSGHLSDWLKAYTPDIALVHLGSNDIFQNQSVASTLDELEQVIEILRTDNPQVVVFLARLLPAKDSKANQRISALNSELHKVTKRTDKPDSRVLIVDHFSDFNVDTETYDGVHPNQAGEEKMAQRWFDAIDGYFKRRNNSASSN